MPPLEDIVPERGMVVVGAYDGFDEHEMAANEEVEQNLLGKVDAMQMESTPQILNPAGNCEQHTVPFVQFSDEDVPNADPSQASKKYVVEQNFFRHMQQSSGASPELSGRMGPRSSDMIPAMRGISNLYVSFGSATDISMANADSVLGKRTAGEEEEVQGQHLDLSLGLNYGDASAGGQLKRGKTRKEVRNHKAGPTMGTRGGQTRMKATGHVSSVKKANPHVWLRPEK
jgi:hypothetical protein